MHKIEFTLKGKPLIVLVADEWDKLVEGDLLKLCYLLEQKNNNVKEELKTFLGAKTEFELYSKKVEEEQGYIMRTALACHFAGSNGPDIFFEMNHAQLQKMMKLQDFLFEEIKLTKFLIKSVRIGLLKYYSPGDNCRNTTVAEMAYADNALASYVKTKDEQHLNKVIAALYRPTNPWRRLLHLLTDKDIRIKFDDRIANRRAKKFAKLPEHIKQAIYYQIKGCRTMEAISNPELYGEGSSKLGWAGTLISMAGTKFGPLDDTEKTLWCNALVLMKQMEHDRRKIEKTFNKKKDNANN